MSIGRAFKLWLLDKIDPRLKIQFLGLEIEDNTTEYRERMRERRAIRNEMREINELRNASKRTVEVQEETAVTPRKKRVTTTVRETKSTKKKASKKEPKEKKEPKARPKSRREEFLAKVAKFRETSQPVALPQSPFQRVADTTNLPAAGTAYGRLREFCAQHTPENRGDKIVVNISDIRKRASR